MTSRVYFGFGKADPARSLAACGPNITEWPKMPALAENLLLELAAVIQDPVTTTDELIPSGETSSYRSNPLKLAQFTLSRRDAGLCAPGQGRGRRWKAQRAAGRSRRRCGDAARRRGLTHQALAQTTQFGSVHLRQQARRRLRPGAGRLLPAGAGRLRQHLL